PASRKKSAAGPASPSAPRAGSSFAPNPALFGNPTGPRGTKPRRIVIVSDGTGETAVQMIKAALVQFNHPDVAFTRYKNIRERDQVRAICEDVAESESLMVYTLVSPRLRAYVRKTAN